MAPLLSRDDLEEATAKILPWVTQATLLKQYDNASAALSGGIMLAVENGSVADVRALLRLGLNVNLADTQGNTLLMYATVAAQVEMVKLLLEFKADVNAKTHAGVTALLYAAECESLEIANLLIERAADINASADDDKYSVLMVAANYGRKDLAQMLIEEGADINAQNGKGGKALGVAAREGYPEIVKLLYENSADVNAKDENTHTALMLAARRGHTDVIELLLELGAYIHATCTEGATPLMAAAVRGQVKAAQLLIGKNVNINEQMPANGFTALHWAVKTNQVESVKILLAAKADITIKDKDQKSAFQYAVEQGNHEMVAAFSAFVAHDPNGNEKLGDIHGATLTAAQRGHVKVVDILLTICNDPVSQRAIVANAWSAATSARNPAVMQLLSSKYRAYIPGIVPRGALIRKSPDLSADDIRPMQDSVSSTAPLGAKSNVKRQKADQSNKAAQRGVQLPAATVSSDQMPQASTGRRLNFSKTQ